MTTRSYGKTTERGYGRVHQVLRSQWAPIVATGRVRCWRPDCRRLIHPTEEWHLGHDDRDRNYYRGPEHAVCNTTAPHRPFREAAKALRFFTGG